MGNLAAPRWWRSATFWAIALLASQYATLQLATGLQNLDAPRNLQWGIYLTEQPRFLLDAENAYDRVNGFPPPRPGLAPAGLANGRSAPLHPWWGPTYLGAIALVWAATRSYTAVQLIVPAAAGALVALTYVFGARRLGRRAGLAAAVLLALFPNFRETATVTLVEPISALLMLGALWAYLGRRAWLAALLGALAALGKVDMIVLYFGTVAAVALVDLRREGLAKGWRAPAVALIAPSLALAPWLFVRYVVLARPTTVGGGPSLDVLREVAPLMLDQVFTIWRPLTLVVVAALAALAAYGAARGGGDVRTRAALAVWVGLGLVSLGTYMALPGASNNPRVFIPALPALMLLVGAGLDRVGRRPRVYALALVGVVYLLANGAGLAGQLAEARVQRTLDPVWAALRGRPAGAVMTEAYWEAALYARQPATWFEHDPDLQASILGDAQTMRAYLESAPVRYVVLPAEGGVREARPDDPLVGLLGRLPFGRELVLRGGPLASPEVRAFLDRTYPSETIGQYVVYTVRP